jgi:very-short-patch-repair endonuclease
MPVWQAWAAAEIAARPARDVYGRLFSMHVAAGASTEELELICATACLSWEPEGGAPVLRHLLVSAATIDFDQETARLTLRAAPTADPIKVEVDMVDPGLIPDPGKLHAATLTAADFDAHPLDREAVGALARRLVHILDHQGEYRDELEPATPTRGATVTYSPALILRKRSQQGLVQVFRDIADQLRESGEIPEGIIPLVDPDHTPDPGLSWDGDDGALVAVDDDVFLPLPVNAKQLEIIRRVDRSAQTLVQGPPGTGKTHTTAALISHLVAQGKRVLVTAQTDRALKEVREKLPESIRPLSVAVVGAAREDMSQLKVAVEQIGAAATEHDPEQTRATIDGHLAGIDKLRRQRAQIHHDLLEAREAETRQYDTAGYTGTLAAIAQACEADASQHQWLAEFGGVQSEVACPLSNAEIGELRSYLLDERLLTDEHEAGQDLPDLAWLPEPVKFADAVHSERLAVATDASYAVYHGHPAFALLVGLDSDERTALGARFKALSEEGASLDARRESWISPALADIRQDKGFKWESRAETIAGLIGTATPLIERLGPIVSVTVQGAEPATFVPHARTVLEHVRGNGKLPVDPAGRPKLGLFTSRSVRQSAPLFDAVRVDGTPPTTEPALDAFLTWVEASRLLDALDEAWPNGTDIPSDETPAERLGWHVAELGLLRRVMDFAGGLVEHQRALIAIGAPPADWTETHRIAELVEVTTAANTRRHLEDGSAPLRQLADLCDKAGRWADAAPCTVALAAAVSERSHDQYRAAHARLVDLLATRTAAGHRDELATRLAATCPSLYTAMAADPSAAIWGERLSSFTAAWGWAATRSWLAERDQIDLNRLTGELDATERSIRDHVEGLSATRAWRHAASPERITGTAKANLQAYAQLVRGFGKGTGKYAARKQADIRIAMDRCRSSVPVWILPIYRIAEQLRVTPGMFDVVIVDEASQAGVEASFLQYLAPKIVVVGDDKQVSPSAVGIDQQRLYDLAAQYLHDDPFQATWKDPQRSLFDEAKMRFGGLITLVEHRRCVPEIIGFSNRIAYEPDGIRLIPVRQYGADRLEPIKPVYLPDGYTRGITNKVNPVEVEAIVDQIEKCLADPRYDGLTFGVISLLGPAQAKEIEKALLGRLAPEEWTARDLRCGDSAGFQGSERDVIFLSMVAAPEPGKRLAALAKDTYVQRYNVAASRAKDQMWLFHSVALEELGNPDDMRFALLDYAYGVVKRGNDTVDGPASSVPEDTRVAPFDSLFEQRVFNRLADRGYSVVPQFPVEGYRIDLVVVGPHTRLAIECDGDAWHGRDAYEADLARQRDLERCGWQFFRIPEFRFYLDPAAALAQLWDLLDDLDIHPSGWTRPVPVAPPTPPAPASRPAALPTPYTIDDLIAVLDEDGDDVLEDEEALWPQESSWSAPARNEEECRADPIRPLAPTERGITTLPAPQAPAAGAEIVQPDGNGSARPASYLTFSGRTSNALTATRAELVEELVAIVAAEGPVLGERLHQAHVKASGGQRVGRQIAQQLNVAMTKALASGRLVEDNPLGQQGIKPKTYRLPNQPTVNVRTAGPRTLEQIPPAELAAAMTAAARITGWTDSEWLYRATLAHYGWVRLGANVLAHLEKIKAIAAP